MEFIKLEIKDSYKIKPQIFTDKRGLFLESFKNSDFKKILNKTFDFQQKNISKSKINVLRGIHFTKNYPGQEKIVTCLSGKFLDLIIDLRQSSETFLKIDTLILDSEKYNSVYIPAGVGHSVVALEEGSILDYICSVEYNRENEFTLYPFDADLKIDWEKYTNLVDADFLLSDKDKVGYSLSQLKKLDLLPE